jgi:uncharacterized membrane protein
MVPLIIAFLVVVLVVFPLWALIRILSLGKENDALAWRLADLERELRELRDKARAPAAEPTSPAPAGASLLASAETTQAPPPAPAPVTETPLPPTLPPFAVPPMPTAAEPVRSSFPPPPLPPEPAPVPPTYEPAPAPAGVNWEQFMGAKLFAWLGGLAAFLGAAFFVKYSFEHDLIPPEVRVAIGYLFAIGLVIGGLKVPRARYAITSQTLCATGIVCLYAVTFACNSIYHFAFFGPFATFTLMTLVTATAFFLAVRLEAQVVGVLGVLGGFLTPMLLSTGRDNALGLFAYTAFLDVGLIAIALHRRWHYLVPLSAAGTVCMQLGWAAKFLNGDKAPTAMVVCLAFCVIFLGAYFVARWWTATSGRREDGNVEQNAPGLSAEGWAKAEGRVPPQITWSAVAFPLVAFAFAAVFLGYGSIAAQPALLFSFVIAADLCLLAIAWWDEELPKLHLAAGMIVFVLLAAWTGTRLTDDLLPWALALYLVHAILHTAFPLVLERHRPDAARPMWSQLFPPLALLLMLGPLFKLDSVSLAFWPAVLIVDLLAVVLALFTASLAGVVVVLGLTLAATAVWIFRVPATAAETPSLLLVIGGFAVLFFAAGIFLVRRLGERVGSSADRTSAIFGDVRGQIPAFSALLPFTLLVLMTQRLPLVNPSSVFGLALLLTVLTAGLAVVLAIEWLPACALAGVAALEYAWRARHFTVDHADLALGWFLLFYAVFTIYPFVFRRRFAALTGPWAVAALAGVLQFPLVYQLIDRVRPNDIMGVLPALFALPPLISLFAVLRASGADERARLNQLAWFGGVALFFITLVFPIQFERQWITLGWALEGVALLWLFHRVPHPALRATGVVLLTIAFVRLSLNPAVLEYRARSDTPIFNWYLYSYGIVTACLFAGARLVTVGADGNSRVLGVNPRAWLATLGTVLAFLLLNLEIADYFSVPGAHALTFEFSGNFARDMTYTIAWALFALGLLLVSFWKKIPAGRYAAISLLGVALLKLFFHDLARLEALYRIGALFAVAVIAIVASIAYQRFLPSDEKSASAKR